MVNLAVDSLVLKRAELVGEQSRMNEHFNNQISEIETAIETLSGKKVWETPISEIYDDESPNYIKSSQEEI